MWRERFVWKNSIVLRLLLCFLRTFRGFYGFHSWRVLLRRFSSHVRVFVDQRIEEFVRLTRSGLVTALNRQRQIVCSCVFLVFDLQHLFQTFSFLCFFRPALGFAGSAVLLKNRSIRLVPLTANRDKQSLESWSKTENERNQQHL